jgi:hypothetical protein
LAAYFIEYNNFYFHLLFHLGLVIIKNKLIMKTSTNFKSTFKLVFLVVLFFISCGFVNAQETFDQLKNNYSGNVIWDAGTSTVTFTSTGTINFTNKATNYNDPYGGQTLQAANWMWNVPTTVHKIVIKKNVTVTGGFHTKGNITITGEDQNTSVIYGTPLQSWADQNNPKGMDLDEWHYCQIQVYGGVCTIQKLKILDPFSFAVRGWGPQVHMKRVSVIDTRGGWGNHSDGFEGGDNSTIDSCFFETGDDNIKVYFKNLKVTNTEIVMVQNSVPIQFGWGNYNDNASATFENCKITGTNGRGSDKQIIDNAGSTQRNKTVVMNNCYIENINGTIFRTAVGVAAPSAINVTINNSYVKVKKYESAGYNANGTRTICGTTDKLTFYDCRTTAANQAPTVSLIAPANNATFISPASVTISANASDTDGNITKVEFYNGTTLLNTDNSSPYLYTWTGVVAGNYSITAKAYDNDGATKTSSAISITVTNSTQGNAKPNVWIQTDLTAALSYPSITTSSTVSEAETDQGSDADDHVALANYLMLANKFNTVGIVLGVTNRNTTENTKTFFDNTFLKAYTDDYACLKNNFTGYPTPQSLNVMESSLTAGSGFTTFKNLPETQYDNYANLPGTVKSLVDELKSTKYSATSPLYVLVWGGLTESAMAIKHLQRTGNTAALNRLYIISHWTSSFINQGTPQDPFNPANCRSAGEACDFVHNEAKKSDAAFKFVDLGSIGQEGIVSGYGGWFSGGLNGTRAKQFRKSKLGDLLIKSKFVFGKPDGSDCATYYALLGTYGVKLSDFNSNGVLTEADENAGWAAFRGTAHDMLDELLSISDKSFGCVITEIEEVSENQGIFVYPNPTNDVININHSDSDFTWELRNIDGQLLKTGQEKSIELVNEPSGIYFLKIENRVFKVSKQ